MVDLVLTGGFWTTTEKKKARTFRKFSYRGVDLDQFRFPSSSNSYSINSNERNIGSSTSRQKSSAISFMPVPAGGSTAA